MRNSGDMAARDIVGQECETFGAMRYFGEDVKLENAELHKRLEDKAEAQYNANNDILEIVKKIAGQVDSLCKTKNSKNTKSKGTEQ